MSAALQRAQCLNHPRREAAARCTACGESFCRECVTELDSRWVCGSCHRAKVQVKDKPKRDWFVLTSTLQLSLGLSMLWLAAWLLGRVLLTIPSEFHEGTRWENWRGMSSAYRSQGD
ncbi:MAG: rhomboid family protein [Roseimicrobium sp.]